MKVRARESADPVVRMIRAVSPSISARATMPCLNSSGNVASDASSTPRALQAIPGERQRHPALVLYRPKPALPPPTAPFQKLADSHARATRGARETKETHIVQ